MHPRPTSQPPQPAAATAAAAVGIDIGGGSIKAVVLERGHMAAEAVSPRYARADARTLRDALASVAGDLGVRGPLPVGIAVPGVLDAPGRRVELAVNIPGLMGLDLDAEVRAILPETTTTLVVTDALASTLGHWSLDPLPGRVLALVLGTGVGACILDDGEPLVVVDHCPGHIGQIDVGPCGLEPAPTGPDGGRHSLEAYLGAPALRERFGDPVPGLLAAPPDDPALVALARTIRIAMAIYKPEHVVLLGGVGIRLGPRLDDIAALVADRLTSVAPAGWTLTCGSDDGLGARGAAFRAARLARLDW